MPTKAKKSDFMLLLRQPHTGPHPTPEEMKEIMDRFSQWMEGMQAKGIVVGTSGLEVAGAVLRGPKGTSMTDGPYLEAKEIVGGYVILKVANLQAAINQARACPGLDYRMAVEVRPVKYRHQAKK